MAVRPASTRLVLAVGIEPGRARVEGEIGLEMDGSVAKDAVNAVRSAFVTMRLPCLAGYILG